MLFGEGHLNQDTSSGPAKPTSSAGFNSFAWELGAGVKLNIERRFTVLRFEVDLLHTSFNHNGSSDVRLAIGGAIHF
ncbi:MAG TPA: hypothetical protein VNE83_07420 [Terriglobales bacterium]|nr:hypothetical protein [Terriglobales bacterium]